MKKNTILLLSLFVGIANSSIAQTTVTFLNTGKMYVAPGSTSTKVALYIPDAMRHLGASVELIQNGITELGGNFYQDATNNIFPINVSTTLTTSTGKFRFVGAHAGVNRYITTQSAAISTFDRGADYIAFPTIEIDTNDSIVIPGRMGIDASSIRILNSKTGKLILRSEVVGINAYDASLRITSPGTSASLVDAGAVVVERDMTTYRPSNKSTQLFGFATPFKNTQLSGYFAGNWLRRPLANGTYGHTAYIYGNKDTAPVDNVIDDDQYIYLAAEKLVPGQAYFVKPRPDSYSYNDLKSQSGLWYTGENNLSAYDKGKFSFNGKVYTVTPYREQLFADDVLFSNSINNNALPSTVNWLIGNSYTCPISISLLKDAIDNSALVFSPYIYVYPAGAMTYQPFNLNGGIQTINLEEIPAMTPFMIRVSKGQAQNGSLSITKSMLRHASVAHNNPEKTRAASNVKSSASAVVNQVVFKVYPSDNANIYDVASIGLRADASTGSDSYDMAKAYVNDDNIFQLYTLSSTQTKLSSNGLPLTADSITLALAPSKYGGNYVLSTKYAETLTTEGLWIYDTKTKTTTDMKTSSYSFTSEATDIVNRFLITFRRPVITENETAISGLNMYCSNDKVIIKQLTSSDMGSTLKILDVQGKVLRDITVSNYPEMTVNISDFMPGVYVASLRGIRSTIGKFIISK